MSQHVCPDCDNRYDPSCPYCDRDSMSWWMDEAARLAKVAKGRELHVQDIEKENEDLRGVTNARDGTIARLEHELHQSRAKVLARDEQVMDLNLKIIESRGQ